MKIVCPGLDLSDAANTAAKACSAKNIVPILSCLKLCARNDTLTLSATDGEISIIKTIKAEVLEEGEICIQGKYFADFVKRIEMYEVSIETKDAGKMELRYGDGKTAMQTLSADDFPEIDTKIEGDSFKLKVADFKRFVDDTVFCCAVDEARPILKGCQFVLADGDVCVTALDGFRLATIYGKTVSSTGNMEIVAPARTLSEIEKMLPDDDSEIEIFVQHGMMLISTEDTILTSKLYTGDFIKKENIIPKTFTTEVEVNREKLLSCIDRAEVVMRNEKYRHVIFEISENQMRVTCSSEDRGNVDDVVEAKVTGMEIRIALNPRYIREAVSALDEETVVLSLNRSIDPVVCQNKENKDCLLLILPVRISNNA